MKCHTRVRLAAGMFCVLAAAACGFDGEDPAARTGAQDRGSTSAPSGAADHPSSGAASGTTAAAPTAWSTTPVVVDSDTSGQLIAVTAENRDGVDRLSFEFSGDAPGYRVEPVRVITAGPDGDVVDVSGRSFLNVAFTSTTPGSDGPIADDVPTNEDLDLPLLRQVVLAHNVGGSLWFGVGVDADAPTFRVVPLTDPARLVLEVRAG